jgi:hypothetical protein
MDQEDIKQVLMEALEMTVTPELRKLKERVNVVERTERDLLGHFDPIYRRLEQNEAEFYILKETLKRMENEYHALKDMLNTIIGRLATAPAPAPPKAAAPAKVNLKKAPAAKKKQPKQTGKRRATKRK